jgi:hypothetical protein
MMGDLYTSKPGFAANVGIDENKLNFTIYPNPTNDLLNFEGFKSDLIEVSIFDVLGKNVMEQSVRTNETLDVSSLTNGVYVMKINNTYKTKFVKE